MQDLRSLTQSELVEALASMGEKKFRAAQIYQWLHVHMADSFDEMTNLSAVLRQKLKDQCRLITLKPVKVLTSQIDGTKKFLFELPDGNIIESVWMQYHHGNSVCISSQVGCRMGCRFCASTLDGLVRGLEPSEMLQQIYQIEKYTGQRVDSVVVMGSGEPMDNYDNFVKFVRLITDEKGHNLSGRAITVSTCGLVPQMYKLAEEGLSITLALSLHASDDETRRQLMPIANKYSLQEVLAACDNYFEKTGRRISFEYSLVHGVNDTLEGAKALAALLGKRNCHVNLIPVNPIKERDFTRGAREETIAFKNVLEKNGINATIRREMGRDIDGACGQLRRSYLQSDT
ncbi:MAG: 23S rRNA (adenine(2503)-C(2))-methyltransferase RlmN [Lachnospiraceae bacterium]|nr:23S rRNA (adenine(2503)-C(2))-methyltransferase RlmN [Lachnospiraceae bacterium]